MSVFTNPASHSMEQGAAYTAAILDLLADQDPLGVLQRTESQLRQGISGLSRPQLTTREAPDKWSIAQVVQHLADSDLVWGWRMRLVFAQHRPSLTGYDQDAWAERLAYNEAKVEEALREFGVLRQSNLRLLRRASPSDLQRVGVHAERGEESIAHMIRLYAGHDLLHLRQIARIRATVARPVAGAGSGQ